MKSQLLVILAFAIATLFSPAVCNNIPNSEQGLVTVDLKSYQENDTVYVGTLFIDKQGSPDGKFIFDTGSDWVVTNNYYFHKRSDTISWRAKEFISVSLLSVQFIGLEVEDMVCLKQGETCVKMHFVEGITVKPESFVYDGVIGMGPIGFGKGVSLIDTLHKQGVIAEPKATFWLNKENIQSNLTLGGVPEQFRDIPSISLQSKNTEKELWNFELTRFVYGTKDLKVGGVTKAIIDTGTSLIQLPKRDYQLLITEINEIEGMRCDSAFQFDERLCAAEGTSCEEFYPKLNNLTFHLNGHEISLPPSAYTQQYRQDDTEFCIVAIQGMASNLGIYVLGTPFISYFTTTFDYANNSVELRVNPLNKNATLRWQTISEEMMGILVVVILVAVGSLLYSLQNNDTEKKDKVKEKQA